MTDRERMGPPPIEPLSDAAWSRIERGLWARVDQEAPAEAAVPHRRRWLWVAAPLAAAAAVVIALGVRGGDPGAPHGGAEPARVVSGAAPTSLLFGDIHVALDADSALVMSSRALLERGGASFAVPPRMARPPFVVTAGDVIVRVIGTQLRVARAGEEVSVEVQHGVVEVQFRSTVTKVGAGQRWISQRPNAVESIEITAAIAAPITAPETPDVSGDTVEPAPPPKSTARPKAVATQPVKPPPQPDASEAEFHRLSQLEPLDPTAAVAGYLELAHGQGKWAAPALFAAGRLSADRNEPRALVLLQRYINRYPRGANVADAKKLLKVQQQRQ